MSFANPPRKPTIPFEQFTIQTPRSELDDLESLLEAARLPTEIYENTQTEDNFGVTRGWVGDARQVWLNDFDWSVSPLCILIYLS